MMREGGVLAAIGWVCLAGEAGSAGGAGGETVCAGDTQAGAPGFRFQVSGSRFQVDNEWGTNKRMNEFSGW
jgi:hypothetical protein